MLFSVTACGNNNNDLTSSNESGDFLYGNAVDDEDEDDIVENQDGGVVSNQQSGNTQNGNSQAQTGNTGDGTTGEGNVVNESARQAYLKSIPASLSGKTVRVLVWYGDAGELTNQKYLDFKEASGITVEHIMAGAPNEGDYYQKLNALIMQKSAPDIARLDSGSFPTVVMQNYFQPLKVARLDLEDPIYDIEFMNEFKYNGQYYGAMFKNSSDAQMYLLYFNKEMFERYDITTPIEHYKNGTWDWNQLRDTALKLAEMTGESGQISVDYGGRQFILSCGEDVVKFNNGIPVNNFGSKKVMEAWKFWHDMRNKYNTINPIANHSTFFEGESGMALAADWHAQYNDPSKFQSCDFEWEIAPVPSKNAGEIFVPAHAKLWGIPRNAKEPEAAGYWMRYAYDNSMNVEGVPQWCNDQVANMIHFLWNEKKVTDASFGTMNYGDMNAGMGGNFGNMCNEFSNTNSENMQTAFDKWSGVCDNKIKQMLQEAAIK